jgi:hypothetical protein|tara:strand:- start:492 stop:836 length:345 start_codon:yes stop_codon:yes gene_type:complete
MSFFDSEVVRSEMAEIQELQEEVYTNVFKFPMMKKEDQRYHVEILERLCDKQKILYTRLSLSDDPEAQKMKDKIIQGAASMGLPQSVDMNSLFTEMGQVVQKMKDQLDKDEFKN